MAAKVRSEKEWAKLVRRWEQSGKSCKAFAEAEGLAWSTLSWWKWRLRSKRQAAPPRRKRSTKKAPSEAAAVRMVEIVPAVRALDGPIELVLGDDVVVRVRRGFDVETLRQVIALFAGQDERAC